jgi:pimeloyl-ACP methyl ester carboxylesterase
MLDAHPAVPVQTARHGAIGVRQIGPADRPALVLLHGIGSGSGSFVRQFDRLGGHFRLIVWDAPGYGLSDPLALPRPVPADYALALDDLADALGLGRFHLLGHSLGSLIAGAYAGRRPGRVKRLILAATAHGHANLADADRTAKLTDRLEAFRRLGPEVHALERAGRLLGPNADAEALQIARFNMARLMEVGYSAAAQCLSQGDLLADARLIVAPTLVLAGGADRITPPAACRATADVMGERARYAEIPGAGHAFYLDAPEDFARHVTGFLEDAV